MRLHSLACAVLWVWCWTGASALAAEWSVAGVMVTPSGILADGTLSISGDGKILSVGPSASAQPSTSPVKLSGVILPGFIDLHDHLTWNIQPRWLPGRKFNNRYEWQDSAEYDRLLNNPHYAAMPAVACEAEIYAEIKALAGGATSVLGGLLSSDKTSENHKCVAGLARNLDTDSGFLQQQPVFDDKCPTVRPETDRKILDVVDNEVFPLELTHERFEYLLCALDHKTLRGMVVHLAEGASTDSAAHREYSMLSKEVLLAPVIGKPKPVPIPRDGLALVHGTALRDADFLGMKDSNVGLIWSPRSNDELYGSTTNIAAARLAKVDIAIAPDWSPSGSAGMLQEMGYAYRHYGVSSDELVAMATSTPAKLVRISDYIGALAPGQFADFVALNVAIDTTRPTPLDPVVKATPANVSLVVVGGQAVYGDKNLLQQLLPPGAVTSELKVCGADKLVNLSGTGAAAHGWTLDDVKAHLKQALEALGTSLTDIECD
ncbi:Cytosine/adenosine deaminase [Bradyrhizobium shewense]|uniref:Cytosine/adenosine deaminase n=1 Tax=Bradyrhizobium shewense TaxID=1761772 RepID=A0A1C3WZJ1_9BRAD|nr:amidohydrolase family protein [Bradyrhizobium shewense]SCB45391.1 Cytosine/adenosine deaminase [Bradyrhizobium shewense]